MMADLDIFYQTRIFALWNDEEHPTFFCFTFQIISIWDLGLSMLS